MIPAGYMYKRVSERPDWLNSAQVDDIYSVSGCISNDFDDWVSYWKHNGYWLFDTPHVIETIAADNQISLANMTLFFYEVYELQWDDDARQWGPFAPEASFGTNVQAPQRATLEGFDVTSFSTQNSAECSPLSCNHMAAEIAVNRHCLVSSFEAAKALVEAGAFDGCEPGPYRIFAVYRVERGPAGVAARGAAGA